MRRDRLKILWNGRRAVHKCVEGRERGEGVGCVSRAYNPPSPSVLGVDGGWQGRREAKLCEECAISEQSTRWRRAGFGGRGWGPGKGASTGVLVWCAMTVNPPLSVSLSLPLSLLVQGIYVCVVVWGNG